MTGPITVWEDNQSCIKQAANPCDREAQKHIDVRAHYLRTSSPKQRLNELCFDSLTDSRRSQQKITEAGLFFFEFHRNAMGLAFITTPSHKNNSVAFGLTSSRQRVDVRRALHLFSTSRVAGVCWHIIQGPCRLTPALSPSTAGLHPNRCVFGHVAAFRMQPLQSGCIQLTSEV